MQVVRQISVLSFSVLLALGFVGCNQSATTDGSSSDSSIATANAVCPIMGGKVSAKAKTVEWNGKTIGFCCDGCDEEFMALSDEEKAEKLAAAADSSEDEAHQAGDHDHS